MRRIPLFWISSAFILGIVFASVIRFEQEILRIAFFLCAIIACIEYFLRKKSERFKKSILPIFLLFMVSIGGAWRYTNVRYPTLTVDQLAFYNNQGEIKIAGVLCAEPQNKDTSTRLVVCVNRMISPVNRGLTGKAMIIHKPGDWRYGDSVEVKGKFVIPDEDEEFSYKEYLAQRSIQSLVVYPNIQLIERGVNNKVGVVLFSLRRQAYATIEKFIPQPEAGLLSGILLGIETDIPGDLKRAFQNTGTDHIIAISGFNMTILAGIFLKGFRKWLSIWWAALLAILTISLYTIMVGGAPAVARAAVMSSLAMSANLIGRGQSGKYTLLLTVAVMNLFNPLLLWNAGFQLSVMATLGLVLYADRLNNWFKNLIARRYSEEKAEKLSGPVSEYILFTLAAQLTTLPVVLYHFEQVSLTAILANPLILPVQPLVMIMGGISVMIGMLIAPLGQLLSYPVWVLLFYTNQIVTWLAEFSTGIVVIGKMTWIGVLFLYGIIFLATNSGNPLNKLNLKKPIFIAITLITATFLVWNAVLLRADNQLHIWVLDESNQGALFIQTPSGKKVLINAGESANQLSSEINKHIPIINKTIDLAIVTDRKEKEYQGFIKILDRFNIKRFLWAEDVPPSVAMEAIINSTRQKKVEVGLFKDGSMIDFGDEVFLEKWDRNKTGISFILRYRQFRFVYLEELKYLDNQVLDGAVVVLKPGLDPNEFKSNRTPQAIFHHEVVPDKDQPGQISTSEYGIIEINTDGEQMWLSGEKR